MMKHLFYISVFFYLFSGFIQAQNKEIEPYINFLEKQNINSVDYILQLFEEYDIVILGERDHRDTTQYELIDKIISDERFIKNVGNVFTEVGTSNRKDWINKVLKDDYPSIEIFYDSLRAVYREMDYMVLWDKYNYWMFLVNLYKLNASLPQNKKINYYPSDTPFDWEECKTLEEMKHYQNYIWGYQDNGRIKVRDSIMGTQIINEFEKILADKTQSRKKALVVLNTPYSLQKSNRYLYKPATAYLFEKYPGRVANVMINWFDFCNEKGNPFVQEGKWDAAFKYLKNPSVGFNFRYSPFGEDEFDICLKEQIQDESVKYQDLYTGFVFYKPLTEWKLMIGIPGIVTPDFLPELMRRDSLYNPTNTFSPNILTDYYNKVREIPITYIGKKEIPFNGISDFDEYIDCWFKE